MRVGDTRDNERCGVSAVGVPDTGSAQKNWTLGEPDGVATPADCIAGNVKATDLMRKVRRELPNDGASCCVENLNVSTPDEADIAHFALIASMKVVREKGVTVDRPDLLESLFVLRVRFFFGIPFW